MEETSANVGRCFACGRVLSGSYNVVDTHEDQCVRVGLDCGRKIIRSGAVGYQPPKGGPRLFPMTKERHTYFAARGLTC
jgi:hypothetical protein